MKSTRVPATILAGVLALTACTSGTSTQPTPTAAPPTQTVAAATTAPPTASPSTAAAGCPIASPPAGASTTTITTWVDPRPCAWTQTYPTFAPATVGDGSLKRVQTAGKITVCAETDINPIVYTDPSSGKVIGFEPDILQELTKRLGIASVSFVNTMFVSYIPSLQAHKCDIVMGGIAVTAQRAQAPGIKYAFPYFRFADVVIVRADSPYQQLSDLKGKKWATVTGSIEETLTKQIADQLGGGTSVQAFTAIDSAYLALLNDTDQAFIDLGATFKLHPSGDKLRALPGIVQSPVDPLNPYFPASGAAITASADGDLNAALAVGVSSMIKDGSLQTILTKWGIYQAGVIDFIRP